MTSETRIVEVRQNALKKNDLLARDLRQRFRGAGVFVVTFVSSPGSGKTTLLEQTLAYLQPKYRVAALVGDLATENDAARLARSGASVKQITTGTLCHLEAEMVQSALDGWDFDALDFLFIENVGNLVCPADFDIGQHLDVVLLSVAEGDDKPEKYPVIFRNADLVLITKVDLLPYLDDFDVERARRAVSRVRGDGRLEQVSVRTSQGLNVWTSWLTAELETLRQRRRSPALATAH